MNRLTELTRRKFLGNVYTGLGGVGPMLDERATVSYPDGFQASDGTIYISWDRNRSTDGEILMARFSADDILAGAFKGPKSKTKMLISRPLTREAECALPGQ